MLISIIEGIYIIYMFNYFKTCIYISHPFDTLTQKFNLMDHSEKENHICKIGNIIGYIAAIWFILRNYIKKQTAYKYNKVIIYSILIGCILTNMNAFIYFLPIFFIEKIWFNL